MIKSSRQKDKKIDDNLIKDKKNLFRLKKYIYETIIKDVKNLFKLKKIKQLKIEKEHEEKDYYKPVRAGSFWSNNYIEYESNGDRIKHYQLKNILIKLDQI